MPLTGSRELIRHVKTVPLYYIYHPGCKKKKKMLVKPSLAASQLSTLPALPALETVSHPSVLNALLIAHPTLLAALTSNKKLRPNNV